MKKSNICRNKYLNMLPDEAELNSSISEFKRDLKKFLFQKALYTVTIRNARDIRKIAFVYLFVTVEYCFFVCLVFYWILKS